MKKGDLIRQFLSEEQLSGIAAQVGEAERGTSGEVRVVIREKPDLVAGLLRLSLRKLAIEEFYRLRMQRTQDRTGVILFFLLSRRQFYIYGDRGIDSRVGQGVWDGIAAEMSRKAKEGMAAAIGYGLSRVGEELRKHFPAGDDDRDELPNDVEIR